MFREEAKEREKDMEKFERSNWLVKAWIVAKHVPALIKDIPEQR